MAYSINGFRAYQEGEILTVNGNSNYDIAKFFTLLHEDTQVLRLTGLTDPYGTEICEGDHFGQPLMMVCFIDGCFTLGGVPLIGYLNGKCVEQVDRVRGNVYENR